MASRHPWALPSPLVKRTVVLLALVALIAPASAAAHATLIKTTPADGAVLNGAPQSVRVEFDDRIHVASGNAAVSNTSNASVLDGAPHTAGHTLVLPLRAGLANGSYSVRWSIVSEDGHREQGVLAFAVGAGNASPQSVLGASAPLSWSNLILRTLFFFGVLAAGGATVFLLLTRGVLGDRMRVPLAHLLFFVLLAAFLGGSGMIHGSPPGHALRARDQGGGHDRACRRSGGRARTDRAAAAVCRGRLLARTARRADARGTFARPRPAESARAAGRRRPHRRGCGLARRTAVARLRGAARERSGRRAVGGGASLLVGCPRSRDRARSVRRRARARPSSQRCIRSGRRRTARRCS